MRSGVWALLVITAAVAVLGCGTSDLEGTWEGTGVKVSNEEMTVDLVMSFDSDGTYTISGEGMCSDGTTECESEFSGVYSYNDTSVELTFSLQCDSTDLPDCCYCPSIDTNEVGVVWATCDVISAYYLGYQVSLSKDIDDTWQTVLIVGLVVLICVALVAIALALVIKFLQVRKRKNAAADLAMPPSSDAWE